MGIPTGRQKGKEGGLKESCPVMAAAAAAAPGAGSDDTAGHDSCPGTFGCPGRAVS